METKIKLYVTYYSAGSLHAGGLERCDVWFDKPIFVYIKNTRDWEDEDIPFGTDSQKQGVQKYGWEHDRMNSGTEYKKVSFGKVFGYECGLSDYVWKKLIEHFGDPELRHWADIEKSGKSQPQDFCLELNLKLNIFEDGE